MNYLTVLINKFLHIYFRSTKGIFYARGKPDIESFMLFEGPYFTLSLHLALAISSTASGFLRVEISPTGAPMASLQFVHLHPGPGSMD